MDEKAINKIEELVNKGMLHEINGRTYAHPGLSPVIFNPRPATLPLYTLTGLVDYIKSNKDGLNLSKLSIHIPAAGRVELFDELHPEYKTRNHFIEVNLKHDRFPFETYLDQEQFIIKLQTLFIPTPDLERLIQFVSKISIENSIAFTDDGISQSVNVKKGVSGALREKEIVPSPVLLAPYRTFSEIEQVESRFIFRIQGNQNPKCALFPADGGIWEITAIQRIKAWLTGWLGETCVAIIA